MERRWSRLARATAVATALLGPARASTAAFVTFESGQVRPLALSPDGTRLFAVDTPDDRLEIFAVDPRTGNLTHAATVPVGLEPVAVAARTNTEVWVVNHLSDSVSVVQLDPAGVVPPRVVRTLLVGDEPRDVAFAGPVDTGGFFTRAFVTTAHRGQNSPVPLADLTTPGVGRADVWAFDATDPGTALGGTPLTVITLFGDTPRALAVSPDGGTVYAAVFESGNQTTALSEGVVCDGGASAPPCMPGGVTYPGGLPAPNVDAGGVPGPETGLVAKFNPADGHWEDVLGRNWDDAVRFFLPDDDVFQIDATRTPPAARPSPPHDGQPFAHVGTTLFAMAVNPMTGHVYVTNGESHNEVRLAGERPPCTPLTPGGPVPNSVVGRLSEARITVLDPATGSVTPHHLNKHIDYCTVPSPPGTGAASLATPLGMAVTRDGRTLYVAAFGSSDPASPGTTGEVGVFDTGTLEADTFTPNAASHIVVSGGGASGLVLDEATHRLYVMTRFDDAVSVVDVSTAPGVEVQHLPLYDPEPPSVIAGRPFLYDAILTSSNGEAACASCHVFGDFDSLAWDLGDPDATVESNPNPFRFTLFENQSFHPLKGPMTTQTLRGLVNDGPMHWRGDRTAGNDPGGNPLDSHGAFTKFNAAFVDLLGLAGHCSVTHTQACDDVTPCPAGESCVGLADAEMEAFTDFILQVTLPPNPIRALDGSLTADQQAGHDFFLDVTSDTVETCEGCHVLDPAHGHFGTDGFSSFENEPQDFKIPHLRNAYQKVGMFGMPPVPMIDPGDNGVAGPPAMQPDQVRGFGFLHDGSVDTLFRFHNAVVFNGGFGPSGGDATRRQVEQFVLAFDSDLAPIVGQQVTLTSTNAATVGSRITLMLQRAAAGECDLVVKGVILNPSTGVLEQRGAVRLESGLFATDRATDPLLTDAQVRAFAATAGQELTYTCAPPGEGVRIGIDRDQDGCPDRSELDAGTDPANPLSRPPGCPSAATTTTTTSTSTTTLPPPTLIETQSLTIRDHADAAKRRFDFMSSTRRAPRVNRIVVPLPGSAGDPTLHGGSLVVYDAAGRTSDVASLPLVATRWSAIRKRSRFKGWRLRDPRGPVFSVIIAPDRIVARGGTAGFAYTLDEPAQGRVGVRLQLGALGWCAAAPARTSPPSPARNDTVGRFVAQPRTPAPPSCPALPP